MGRKKPGTISKGRIYKRGGSYYASCYINGRQERISAGKSRKHAARILAWMRSRAAVPTGAVTMQDVWEHYARYLLKTSKPKSVENVEKARKLWTPLDSLFVSELTQSKVNKVRDSWGHSDSTVNLNTKQLRAALRRACKDGLISELPKLDFSMRKVGNKLPPVLTTREIQQLISAAPKELTRTVLYVAAYTGMRHQEILHAAVDDVDFVAGTFSITAKASVGWSPKAYHERAVPMGAKLAQVLKNWIAQLPPRPVNPENPHPYWLFPGQDKARPRYDCYRDVTAAFKAAGLYDPAKRPGLHLLRRSWATHLLAGGADLGTLMRMGGWGSLQVVQRYIGTVDDAARQAIDGLKF